MNEMGLLDMIAYQLGCRISDLRIPFNAGAALLCFDRLTKDRFFPEREAAEALDYIGVAR